ncbi:hypothetical protein GOP47_0020084 [Adiantum capillus-veneris]|uniref:HAT C-terminal dimerisation domain-containing protein n=1 Tax=Adiantum capillus-veneris TaxID=13818 RepID=A0A9D4UCA7_ADICA|nr:hypothetical protein GOP47_0020084 [Adiantum capillus-veneris]
MQKGLKKIHSTQEESLLNLFKTAYFIGRNNLSFALYPSLLALMKDFDVKSMTSLYNDDKACSEMVQCISQSIMQETIEKVKHSPWFGVMVDKSTDISIHHHMVMYLSYLEEGSMPCNAFYGIIRTTDSTAKGIFDTIMLELERSNLDLSRLIAFGSDGCNTMVGRKKGVAKLMKDVNPMLTAIHCVAHHTNLATCDTSKKIAYAKKIDVLVNAIANYFSSSSNRRDALNDLQEEFDCETIKMQRIFEIRWLSRHACITKICKSLDALLVALEKERKDLYDVLSTFECIYALHFLADILQKVTNLSLRFQKDYVDVTTIHGIVKSTILCIKDEYLDERELDLNAAQRGIGGYPIMPDYGATNGYMYALRTSLKGDMFFGQKIMRDVEGVDLQNALDFQFKYAKKLCESLEKCFVDNSTLHAIKILVPAQHPMHERLLKEYGNDECDTIALFYGIAKRVANMSFAPIIDGEAFKVEFRKFKRQEGIDFAKMSLMEVASLLANNAIWKDAFPNILKVCQIALMQCCSIAICEQGFSARTKIKNKWRNRLEIERLNALMVISIEGRDEFDFSNAMEIWKSETSRHLFTQEGSQPLMFDA